MTWCIYKYWYQKPDSVLNEDIRDNYKNIYKYFFPYNQIILVFFVRCNLFNFLKIICFIHFFFVRTYVVNNNQKNYRHATQKLNSSSSLEIFIFIIITIYNIYAIIIKGLSTSSSIQNNYFSFLNWLIVIGIGNTFSFNNNKCLLEHLIKTNFSGV